MTDKRFDPEKPNLFYLLRYLPPKTIGPGELIATHIPERVDCVGTTSMTLARWREMRPDLFETPGFYTLMVATGETLTVDPEKEKKQ